MRKEKSTQVSGIERRKVGKMIRFDTDRRGSVCLSGRAGGLSYIHGRLVSRLCTVMATLGVLVMVNEW